MTLFWVFTAITLAFGIWLALKDLLSLRLCTICLAVSTVWVGLLLAYKIGWLEDQSLLALLMGQSVAGIYYMFEKRAPRDWLLFRLPALLTLTYVFYAVLTSALYAAAALFLVGLWAIFGLAYLLRTKPRIKARIKKLIECCGNW